MALSRRKRSVIATISDWIAIGHFFVAIAVVVVGEVTDKFKHIYFEHGGIWFLYKYLDYPAYQISKLFLPENEVRLPHYLYVKVGVVILLSTILYFIVSYLLLKFITSLFERDG